MSREELIDYIEIIEITNEILKDMTRKRDKFFAMHFLKNKKPYLTYEWLAYFLGVSYEGYNSWRKTKKTGDSYKKSTMEDIRKSWEENGSKFGAFLLWGHMEKRYSLNTIKRYMRHMGLKGKYKVPSTRKKEIKDTKNLMKDYVKGHIHGWKNNKSRSIISTDASEYNIFGEKMYFSKLLRQKADIY